MNKNLADLIETLEAAIDREDIENRLRDYYTE